MRPSLKLLKNKKNLVGCEIGVQTANHAEVILRNLDIKRIYLIDTWDKYPEYVKELRETNNFSKKHLLMDVAKKKLKKWDDNIVWINDYSSEAVKHIKDDELDFVYIDGNHTRPYVSEDIRLYWSKVKPGGLMAGHDFRPRWQGVIDAVTEFFGDNYEIEKTTTDRKPNVDWWVWKDDICIMLR